MSKTDEWIARIEEALKNGGQSEKHALVEEAASVFHDVIPGIRHGLDRFGQRASIPGRPMSYDDDGDLRKLLGKLELRQEEERRELTANPITSITAKVDSDIALCGNAIASMSPEKQNRLIETLVGTYEAALPSIASNLSSYNSGDDYAADLLLIKGRLEVYRSQLIADSSKSSSQNISLANTSSSSAAANVAVDISQASIQVQQLPESALDEECKKELRLLLLDLEEARGKSKEETRPKLQKVLGWLSDKGVDVAIAALPYIAQLIQGLS